MSLYDKLFEIVHQHNLMTVLVRTQTHTLFVPY